MTTEGSGEVPQRFSAVTGVRLLGAIITVVMSVLALLLAAAGGWSLLWLLVIPLWGYNLWRVFGTTGPEKAPARFAEPGNHRVVLQVAGSNPILVIREVRRTTGLGLLAAKQLVDQAPVVVTENLSESSAALVADQLQKAGARALAAPIGEM